MHIIVQQIKQNIIDYKSVDQGCLDSSEVSLLFDKRLSAEEVLGWEDSGIYDSNNSVMNFDKYFQRNLKMFSYLNAW